MFTKNLTVPAGPSDHITVALERGRLMELLYRRSVLEELKLAHDIQ